MQLQKYLCVQNLYKPTVFKLVRTTTFKTIINIGLSIYQGIIQQIVLTLILGYKCCYSHSVLKQKDESSKNHKVASLCLLKYFFEPLYS